MTIKHLRTVFLFIVGLACFQGMYYVAGVYAQHIIDSDLSVSIISSLTGAAFVTFIPIVAHLAIVGNRTPVKDHELTSKSIFLTFGLFWFLVTFFITLFIRSDFLVGYYSGTTVLLAMWTFFGIVQMITTLDMDKTEYKELWDEASQYKENGDQ